jgi:guanylate kinase
MNKLFCLVGPSGTGKDTIKKELSLPSIVSYRTREIREGEIEGVDGKFISKETFLKKENEWVAKTNYSEHYYGITKKELIPLKYTSLIYVIDYEGVESLKRYFESNEDFKKEQIVTIYIDSPYEVLATRMRVQERTQEEIEKRMDQYWEIDFPNSTKCDYSVYNAQGKIKQAIEKIKNIIIEETQKIKAGNAQ